MTTKDFDITSLGAWSRLTKLAKSIADVRIGELMSEDGNRLEKYSLKAAGLYLDYSKNLVGDQVMDYLFELVDESPLNACREAMFCGVAINVTEQRPVLHTALRADSAQLRMDGLKDIGEKIGEQKERMKIVSEKVRSGNWLGVTGKPMTDIVNLGIGGSDLGPKLACEALKEFAQANINCHFVSNVDGEVINSTLKPLNPETTLVIISSKTFTTQETLLNARTAANWLGTKLGLANAYASPHFIGVTASLDNAKSLGIPDSNILEFWDWVGGRYSLWSTIGLSIAISIGFDNFERLLAGAREMDVHFRETSSRQNMPVVLALLGIWYNNFLNAESHAVIPYCERLLNLPFYLQQLDMESNGKFVTLNNNQVSYPTGPIIWGLTGTNGQHSFFQLLHQGTHLIPVDFIGQLYDRLSTSEHHRVLMANMFAQSAALMAGKKDGELPPYRNYPGNRPSNTILMETLTPEVFGALIALYEHKVFVQGCLWNIDSFDQWGVELGKALANSLLSQEKASDRWDRSTRDLMSKLDSACPDFGGKDN